MLTTGECFAASIQDNAIYRPFTELNSGQLIEQLQAGYTVALSDNRPESLIRSPSSLAEHSLAILPSPVYSDEFLDWDVFMKIAPRRPSGTLSVTLVYGGRGTPTPFEDWD